MKFIPELGHSEWDNFQGFVPKEWASYSRVGSWGQNGLCKFVKGAAYRVITPYPLR